MQKNLKKRENYLKKRENYLHLCKIFRNFAQ